MAITIIFMVMLPLQLVLANADNDQRAFSTGYEENESKDENDEEDNVDATNVMLMNMMMVMKMTRKMMLMQPI